ncbi:MAG TPA: hypothetical protein VGC35_01440 [Allosphingosinicella sp.]
MRRLFPMIVATALTGCGSSSPEPPGAVEKSGTSPIWSAAKPQTASATGFDEAVDPERRMVILCDPARFRLSIRAAADAASLDRSYPQRTIIDQESLVAYFRNPGGGVQYQGSLIRYEQCGPLIIRLEGAFLNANVNGEMGAIPQFAAVTVTADNRQLYPKEGDAVRLAECDLNIPRWEDCPSGWAVRIDFTYVPAADPYDQGADRLLVHEWVRSGDVLGGAMTESERRSSTGAGLGRWWVSRH